MENNYLNLLNEKGNVKFREILLEKDFAKYQRNVKKIQTLQKRLQKIESELFGPISEIEAFNDLSIFYKYTEKQPIIVFDLLNNTLTFFRKDEGNYRADEDKVEVATFDLDKLCLFNDQTILTLRVLSLQKLKKYENRKKELKKRNKSKNNYNNYYCNITMDDDILEHFLVLLVSNYKHISYANSDIKKAIENYSLINKFLNFSETNDSIKNCILENFINLFSKFVLRNINEKLHKPSIYGINELLEIQNNCLNTCDENFKKEPNYNNLVEEYLVLSKDILEYEKKLPTF